MHPELFQAVLEEYKSLRTEAVAARDAQNAVLGVGVTLLAALVGVGIGLRDHTALSAAILGVFVPAIVFLTIELWIGEIERSVRAGAVVAAIEARFAAHFAALDVETAERHRHLIPPMGWETWLRRKPSEREARAWYMPGRPSEQQRASFTRGTVIFAFLLLIAIMSSLAGLYFLRHEEPWIWIMLGFDALVLLVFFVRAPLAFKGIEQRDRTPHPDNVWTSAAVTPEPAPGA